MAVSDNKKRTPKKSVPAVEYYNSTSYSDSKYEWIFPCYKKGILHRVNFDDKRIKLCKYPNAPIDRCYHPFNLGWNFNPKEVDKSSLDATKIREGCVYNALIRVCKGNAPTRLFNPDVCDITNICNIALENYIAYSNRVRSELKYKLPQLSSLTPEMGAMIVAHTHYIRMLCSKQTIDDTSSEGRLIICNEKQQYEIVGNQHISKWCSQYFGEPSAKWRKDFELALMNLHSAREWRVVEEEDENLIGLANGIYDYKNRKLIEYSYEHIILNRSPISLPERLPEQPVYTTTAGKEYTPESLFKEWLNFDGSTDFMYQLVGAVMRPRHNWRKLFMFYNNKGSNGKSTAIEMFEALVGKQNAIETSIGVIAGQERFGNSQLFGKSLVACKDSNEGEYIKNASQLKRITDHEDIIIELKHENAFTYSPNCVILIGCNDLPRQREKSTALLNRYVLVPFTASYGNEVADDGTVARTKDPGIKKWTTSKEFLEYILYIALVCLESYDEMDTPKACNKLIESYREDNDVVYAFLKENHFYFEYERVSYTELFVAYASYWYSENPGTKINMSQKALTSAINKILVDDKQLFDKQASGRFTYEGKSDRLPIDYSVLPHEVRSLLPQEKEQVRGLVRTNRKLVVEGVNVDPVTTSKSKIDLNRTYELDTNLIGSPF